MYIHSFFFKHLNVVATSKKKKNRSESMAQNYLETISNMKKQLLLDKTVFMDQIKTLKSTSTIMPENRAELTHTSQS